MRSKLALLTVIALAASLFVLSVSIGVAHASDPTDPSNYTKNCTGNWTGPDKGQCMQLNDLSQVQPGLGTIMIEVANRANVMPAAVAAGNWQLASYQAKEMDEVMEVGTITRPGRKAGLLNFMDDNPEGLSGVKAAIAAKDSAGFAKAYNNMVAACNSCHAASHEKASDPSTPTFNYIQYQPSTSYGPTTFQLASNATAPVIGTLPQSLGH